MPELEACKNLRLVELETCWSSHQRNISPESVCQNML